MQEIDLKELIAKNPQVRQSEIEEARKTIQELRKQGVTRAQYNLVNGRREPSRLVCRGDQTKKR